MTIIIFIAILGILVLVHEWGHFIVAKKSGLSVEEFGFGFPPRIWSIKKGETTYSINLIPLGGFVKILGEDGNGADNPKSFASKPISIRSLITVSGVVMNFILGATLLIIGFYIGLPQALDKDTKETAENIQIQIVGVSTGSPAEVAGLRLGDSIFSVASLDGKKTKIAEVTTLQNFVREHGGREIILGIKQGKKLFDVKITPRVSPPEGEGALGVALVKTGIVSYRWHQSVWLGVKSSFIVTWEIIKGFAGLLKNLIMRGQVPKEVTGPVGIAVLTSQAASLGFAYILNLVALISFNLAVLNLIPFPALDGGRLLFLGIEKIKGSKVNPKVENAIHSVGMVLLLALVVLITYRDILKLL